MELKYHPDCRPFTEAGELSQVEAWYEQGRRILWVMLHGKPRPCFNPELLADIKQLIAAAKCSNLPIEFWITASTVPNIFNVGGDLALFAKHIRAANHEALRQYAHSCIEAVHAAATGFGIDAITIAMIEGTAMGGGYEAALAHDFVLAQSDAKMGFPEIAFNLYPGMGAYSLVQRKAGRLLAEDLIISGASHSGAWYHDKGLVDRTFVQGDAFRATRGFVDELRPKLNGIKGMLNARRRVLPLDKAELIDITEDWARSALHLKDHDVAYMERLVMLQNRRVSSTPSTSVNVPKMTLKVPEMA